MNLIRSRAEGIEERNESPIHQWVKLNRILVAYKYALLIMAVVLLGALALIFWLVNRDTLVVGLTGSEKLFFVGERKSVNISEDDVSAFAKRYIELRYSWDHLRADTLLKEIAPYTSEGLLQKIGESLKKNKALLSQGTLAQDVIVRSIKLEDGAVLAEIDRIIQLGPKMKVVSPLTLTLTLIRGTPNRFNPEGLYVNEIVEHESE